MIRMQLEVSRYGEPEYPGATVYPDSEQVDLDLVSGSDHVLEYSR